MRMTEEEILRKSTEELLDLKEKLGNLADNFYDPTGYGRIFEGNFEMTLIGGDVVYPKAIQLNNPPYRLGEFSRYFHFRIDKPGKKHLKFGDFEWYTSSSECFTEIKNGDKTLTMKFHRDSETTEYILKLPEQVKNE